MTTTLPPRTRHVELRIDGRITPASLPGFAAPLQEALAEGRPFTALYDRRTLSAPTPQGRALLAPLLADWSRVARLVVAWADVYDPRRCASLRRAAAARVERGQERPGHGYPYGLFDDLDEARAWLAEQHG